MIVEPRKVTLAIPCSQCGEHECWCWHLASDGSPKSEDITLLVRQMASLILTETECFDIKQKRETTSCLEREDKEVFMCGRCRVLVEYKKTGVTSTRKGQ